MGVGGGGGEGFNYPVGAPPPENSSGKEAKWPEPPCELKCEAPDGACIADCMRCPLIAGCPAEAVKGPMAYASCVASNMLSCTAKCSMGCAPGGKDNWASKICDYLTGK